MFFSKLPRFTSVVVLLLSCIGVSIAQDRTPTSVGVSVRNDTSPPLSELLTIHDQLVRDGTIAAPVPNYEIPNIFNVDEGSAANAFENTPVKNKGTISTNGLPTAPVIVSVDGYTAADNLAVVGGNVSPPDTNGDVGNNFYIQYVNLGWLVMNKSDGSRQAGPFAGNTFWAGFGGPCQNDNAGDPIVLFDKTVNRWVFSQFTSPNNTDGRQCFAISTTSDPLGPYHRYEFVFPGEFNDYPHIAIWNDESGERSGYYFVTHEFTGISVGSPVFQQASYSVVERDQMLQGNPAQFVRFTNTTFNGSSSYGAQPTHLESKELAPAGMCNPFVLGRPDMNGYQMVDLCVDWTSINNSSLSSPVIVDTGESWSPGPGAVSQPGTSNTLDTLVSFGRIMYRVSFRAYPANVDRPPTMVLNHVVDLGAGHAGVHWAQIDFNPTSNIVVPPVDSVFDDGFESEIITYSPANTTVRNKGEYGPDATDRWMPGISIDRDGNIGMAYSAANSTTGVFPGVRFTTRLDTDVADTMRDEQICVDGGGSQSGQNSSTRWGDYSSVSVDPVDECTFWASVEYQLTTAPVNWSNRVCSFKVDGCGLPAFNFDNSVVDTLGVCTATTDVASYNFGLNVINGFSETVTMSVVGEPATSTVAFPSGSTFNVFPATGDFSVSTLTGLASGEFDMSLTGTSLSASKSKNYHLSLSAAATATASVLSAPVDNAVDAELLPDYSWSTVPDALSYVLEVATDAAFTNIVLSQETTELTFASVDPLSVNTTYFWRVIGKNNCGNGTASAVFQFTTGSFVTGTTAACSGGSSANIVFFDDVEGDVSDWTLPAAPVGSNTWTQSGSRAFSGTSWFAQDLTSSSDQYLVSPAIVLPAIAESPISLSYWNFQSLEANDGTGGSACWDGGLLEISTDGGATFNQVPNSLLLRDNYNGGITAQAASPISGKDAWCADAGVPSTGQQTDFTVVNLDSFAGQTVQFRFRVGTDGSAGKEGWYLDNVTVQSCQ